MSDSHEIHRSLALLVSCLPNPGEETGAEIDRLINLCDEDGGECIVCAALCCPHKHFLHFHHDGCPACAEADGLLDQSDAEQIKPTP